MIEFDFGVVLAEWPMLLRGAAMTLALTAVSALVGVAIGIFGAWSRSFGPSTGSSRSMKAASRSTASR